MGIRDALLGLVRGNQVGALDASPPPIPARPILGAGAARELCMLPRDVSQSDLLADREKRIVQLKVDGIRGLYMDRIHTREGTPLDCALHCQPGLRRLEEAFGHEMFFDGEYAEEDGFNATLAAQGSGKGMGTFWIFDAVPRGAWITGRSDVPLLDRLTGLKERFDAVRDDLGPFVGMLDWWLLDGHDTVAKARELWGMGYEGVVSKRVMSGYTRDRSDDWLRFKEVATADLPIIDIARGPRGELKSIILRGPGDVGPIRIGRGWSDADAKLILAGFASDNLTMRAERALESMLKPMIAEISYQLTTGKKRSVRGATFRRLRLDKKEYAR